MSACTGKPTKYQPTSEEFVCPICDAPEGIFIVDDIDSVLGVRTCERDCRNLHDTDLISCGGSTDEGDSCTYTTTGRAFAALVVKKSKLTQCTHCKGKGMVSR